MLELTFKSGANLVKVKIDKKEVYLAGNNTGLQYVPATQELTKEELEEFIYKTDDDAEKYLEDDAIKVMGEKGFHLVLRECL